MNLECDVSAVVDGDSETLILRNKVSTCSLFLKMVNKHPINFQIFYEIDEQEAEHAESLTTTRKAQRMLISTIGFYKRGQRVS
jgi:hypothetical protein